MNCINTTADITATIIEHGTDSDAACVGGVVADLTIAGTEYSVMAVRAGQSFVALGDHLDAWACKSLAAVLYGMDEDTARILTIEIMDAVGKAADAAGI